MHYTYICTELIGDDISSLIIFIGSGIDAKNKNFDNIHTADDMVIAATTADGLDVGVYKSFRSCYLPGKGSHLKKGSFVLFDDCRVGMLEEFIMTKEPNGDAYKYVRAKIYENTGQMVKDFRVYKPRNESAVLNVKCIVRVVIMYEEDENIVLCIDVNRPYFHFGLDVL